LNLGRRQQVIGLLGLFLEKPNCSATFFKRRCVAARRNDEVVSKLAGKN